MLVDYFLVRSGNLDMAALYTTSSNGKYYFLYGVNVRAVLAFIIGFVIPLPGFIGSFGTVTVSTAATRLYDMGWLLSFLFGGLSYWVLCLIWKVPGQEDCRRPYESMVNEHFILPGTESEPKEEENDKDAEARAAYALA